GTTPADPMASLNALLGAYDLDPGDTVYVDTGYYSLPANVRITAQDSGVTILGPTSNAALSGAYSQTVLADAPSLYYRLDETGGTAALDSSGNTQPGAYINGVQLSQPGALLANSNQSIRLDGVNDYIDLPGGFSSFPNGFTYELWVYPTAVASYQRFLDVGNGQSNNNILLYRRSSSNDLSFAVYNGATAGAEITASGVLTLNQWQHLAVTMDSSGFVRLYRNGQQVGLGQTTAPNDVLRTNNFIGKSNSLGAVV